MILFIHHTKLRVMYKNSRIKERKDVTLDEINIFLALIIKMVVVKKDDLRKYWSTECEVSTPYFLKNMSLKRFESILWNFHINGNNNIVKTIPFTLKAEVLRCLFTLSKLRL